MTAKDIYNLISEAGAGIATDSRNVKAGDIFFALKGDNFDGNKFAGDAVRKGALKAVIDNPNYKTDSDILVDDVIETLQEVAMIHRERFDIPLLAITGTNGKTTTKELIARVLECKYKVHFTRGNLNNHIGVPLSILGADPDTEFMIIEMGANHVGEIAALCKIAKPTAGLISNIGKAHLEGFGSFEGVIKAKSELYVYLAQTGGTIIYNDSNSLLQSIAGKLNAKSVPYSKPDKVLKQSSLEEDRYLTVEFIYNNGHYSIESALAGAHNSENIFAALAVGLHYGVDIGDAIRAIEAYKPQNNRSQILVTDSNTLLCDAYNANPDSMSLAISSFIGSPREKKVIIVGDMMELGSYAQEEHKAVIDRLSKIPDIDIYLVGSIFCKLAEGTGIKSYSNTELLISDLNKNPIKNSFVLIKGSRAIGLERIYDYL